MSLHAAAKHLSTKGRGPDSMLVHMSPKEVHGLQALAKANGGSLTVNPDTGLVEAGFLSDILPIVAAAGLTYLTAGAAAPAIAGALGSAGMGAAAATTASGILAGAGSGALINGGMAAIQGKDVGQAALMGGLGGGVAGGLGAYGDANVFGVGTGAEVGAGTAGQSAALTDAQIAKDAMLGQSVNQLPTAVQPTSVGQLVQGVDGAGGLAPQDAINKIAMNNAPTGAPYTSSGNPFVSNGPAPIPTDAAGYLPPAGAPPSVSTPNAIPNSSAQAFKDQAANQYYQKLGNTGLDVAQKAGIQALPVLSTLDSQPTTPLTPEEKSTLARISPNFRAQEATKPNPYYRAQYAEGGIASLAMGGQPNQMFPMSQQEHTNFMDPTQLPANAMAVRNFEPATNPMNGMATAPMAAGGDVSKKKQRAQFTADRSMAAMDPYEAGLANLNNARYAANMTGARAPSAMSRLGDIPTAAGGGLSSLGGYSDGGRMLKGPGDGMSDNIPATIGGKQPARLADGEFVVPADVVSHLGNGSTDAGAKRLYSMMDKVRRARTGKKKQAPAVNTGRFMPA
jgi:hypothetical protein